MGGRASLREARAPPAPWGISRTADRAAHVLALAVVAALAFARGATGAEVDPNPPRLTLPTFLASSMVLQRAPGKAQPLRVPLTS